jgi:hypothetical protein
MQGMIIGQIKMGKYGFSLANSHIQRPLPIACCNRWEQNSDLL